MKIISCDRCGIVLDLDKIIKYPNFYEDKSNSDGKIYVQMSDDGKNITAIRCIACDYLNVVD